MPFFLRILVPAFLVFLVLVVPSSASAAPVPGCDDDPAPTLESTDDGFQGFFDAPAGWTPRAPDVVDREGDQPTQYELVTDHFWQETGMSGLTWHTIRESCIDHMADAPISGVANLLWMASKCISVVAITLYEWAVSGTALSGLEDLVLVGVEGMRRAFWRPFLGAAIVLGAVWMAWWGLVRQRASVSVEGAVWMVVAVALGIWVTAAPASVLDAAGRATLLGADVAHLGVSPLSGVTDGDPSCPADRGDASPPPASSGPNADLASNTGDELSGREQTAQDHAEKLWSGMMCRPWMAGQFGLGAAGKEVESEYGAYLLSTQSVGRSTTRHIANGQYSVDEVYTAKLESYVQLSENLGETRPDVYPLFAGDRPWDRLGVAGMALMSSVFAGGLLFAVSLSSLVAQMAFMVLLLMAPVFLLIGVRPGKGRTILLRWLETGLGILLRHVVLMLLLMVIVEFYIAILGWDMGWGGQTLVLSMATLALLVYRRKLTEILTGAVQAAEPRRVGAAAVAGAAGAMGALGGRGDPGRAGAAGRSGRSGQRGRSRVSWRRHSAGPEGSRGGRGSPGGARGSASAGSGGRRPQQESGERGRPEQGQGDRQQSRDGAARPAHERRERESGGDPGGSGRRTRPQEAPRLRGRGDPSPPAERDPSPRQGGNNPRGGKSSPRGGGGA